MKILTLLTLLALLMVTLGNNALAQGPTLSDPIVVNNLNTGYYYDARNNAEYGNEIGQPSEDVFYKFILPVSRTVTISTCCSGFDTYLHSVLLQMLHS